MNKVKCENFFLIVILLLYLFGCKSPNRKNIDPKVEFQNKLDRKNLGDTIIISAEYPSIIKEVNPTEKYLTASESIDFVNEKKMD